MSRRSLLSLALAGITLAGLAASPPAQAQAPSAALVCPEPSERQDKFQYLRALSLDLRGYPPSAEEYEALKGMDDVPAEWIDAWMATEDFARRTSRWHRGLLWHNIAGQALLSVPNRLRASSGIYWRGGTLAVRLRGANTHCGVEPATFDASGELQLPTDEQGVVREGYVEVKPYWAPETTVRVCALDARETLVAESGAACGERTTVNDTSCGCGPNLQWCAPSTIERQVTTSMNAQIDRLIHAMVLERRSYLELFTGHTTFVNGPIVHYLTKQTGAPSNLINEPAPIAHERLPKLAFTDADTWVEIDAGPQHAGILTAPAYLLRFQTDRARANQFYTQFMCQPFQPPSNGISVSEDAGLAENDLQKRDGCKYCHAILEPAASHWGRWRERGAGYLDEATYPAQSDACRLCATTGRQCSRECRDFYILDTQDAQMASYAGYLSAYLFRAPEHAPNVERGPRLLAMQAAADGRLPQCVASRNVEHLFGRAGVEGDRPLIDELVRQFARTNYDWTGLIRAIVTSETYRRVR